MTDAELLRTLARIAKTLQAIGDELSTAYLGPSVSDARARRAGHCLRRISGDLDALIDEQIAQRGSD